MIYLKQSNKLSCMGVEKFHTSENFVNESIIFVYYQLLFYNNNYYKNQ